MDRWLVNDTARLWAVDVGVDKHDLSSDHNGKLMHVRSPDNSVRTKKPPQNFPVPQYARARVDNYVAETLGVFAEKVNQGEFSAQAFVIQWDARRTR